MNKRILIVDHDREQADRLRRPLADAGYQVELASDGIEALDGFQSCRPGLTVVSAELPDGQGFELCQMLKHAFPGEPLILLVLGEGQEPDAATPGEQFWDGQFNRPIADEQLLTACEHLLSVAPQESEIVEVGGDSEWIDRPTTHGVGTVESPAAATEPVTESAADPSGEELEKQVDSALAFGMPQVAGDPRPEPPAVPIEADPRLVGTLAPDPPATEARSPLRLDEPGSDDLDGPIIPWTTGEPEPAPEPEILVPPTPSPYDIVSMPDLSSRGGEPVDPGRRRLLPGFPWPHRLACANGRGSLRHVTKRGKEAGSPLR